MYRNLKNSILFNPIWIARRNLDRAVKKTVQEMNIKSNEKWLDVCCGTRPYEQMFPVGVYVGVDVEESGRDLNLKMPDYFYNGETLPFENDRFDGVINTQVLEHVKNPVNLIGEMHRVIKPGGRILISLPFVWQEHEEPYDYLRFTEYGIKEILLKTGFSKIIIAKDTGFIETLAVMLNVYIVDNLIIPRKVISTVMTLLFCFPVQIIALFLQKFLPDKNKLYLNLIVSAEK